MKILFITTHNLTTNPRLVKEIMLAVQLKLSVEVICFHFDNWSQQQNELLVDTFRGSQVRFHIIPAGRKPFLKWITSVMAERSARILGNYMTVHGNRLANAVSRRNSLILARLGKVSPPDLVVGHNPGALWATMVAKQKFSCRAGFDVEDYHPGEGKNLKMQELTRKLMQTVLPDLDYVSFASPLIRQAVDNDLSRSVQHPIEVLNYFPAEDFSEPVKLEGRLKLIWFSQNVTYGRGLEYVLPFIKSAPDDVELHLIGHMDDLFYKDGLTGIDNIFIHPPTDQKKLHRSLSQFDVGLALEPSKDKNNELAVSNKILAYLQAGLFILATSTPGQKQVLTEFPLNGKNFDPQSEDVAEVLQSLIKNKAVIRNGRIDRFRQMLHQNWEQTSGKLVSEWTLS